MVFSCGAALPAGAQDHGLADREALRQQERERALRQREERGADVRLKRGVEAFERLPSRESPCFPIQRIVLEGEASERFGWALKAADPAGDPARGRCLGTQGVNVVLKRVQNAIIARGWVTTRVLAAPQDLKSGVLALTLVPGRIGGVRLDAASAPQAGLRTAVPARPGALLNLRDIEQALENFQRVPTVRADIQIVPTQGEAGLPGQSDLLIAWGQRGRVRSHLSLDDAGSRATGKLQAGATLSLDNGLHLNDLFYVNLGRGVFNGGGRETSSWTVHYDLPYGYWLLGATAGGYEYGQTVAGAYESYVYSGTSGNAELRVDRLLLRDADSKTGVHARGWLRRSNSFIDDTEVLVQRRRTAGWELGVSHKRFLAAGALDLGLAYRRGTGAFGALHAPEEAFGEGTSRSGVILANAQWGMPLRWGGQRLRYAASWRGQWNRTPLVQQDHFAIGGRYSVRGFDGESSLSGARGWWLRNDLGLALGGGQELYLGADYGRVGRTGSQRLPGGHLAGAVVGLRGGWRGLYWDGFVGAPIHATAGFPASGTVLGFSLGGSH
ncbi:ShlB/FhaC/HecB family hemolysin secretion/activation protein [Pseudoxanthomonas broegbernensis]|nr:ShlB/FhaC/HecB family hemolysin secretion/activation protein [Pseudoxanthomonas broegbernensis]